MLNARNVIEIVVVPTANPAVCIHRNFVLEIYVNQLIFANSLEEKKEMCEGSRNIAS